MQCGEKILFHPGKILLDDGITRNQNQFHRLRKIMLVPPETFPEQPPGAATNDGSADFLAGDDTELGSFTFGKFAPVGDEAAQNEPFPPLPDAREIAVLRKPRRTAQAQAWRRGIHKSNRREAFAARATAARDGGRATLGLVAGEEAVLAFPADFRRLILAFHKFLKLVSGAKTGA